MKNSEIIIKGRTNQVYVIPEFENILFITIYHIAE
jgi:hypothetical protein